MKKSLFVLSLLAAVSAKANAQSSVTMYGVLDAGISYEMPATLAPATAGNKISLSSGIATPSRIGFKGYEDFGGSLKAVFQLEAGVQLNDGQSTETGTLFNRASWIGLTGDFGAVTLGRQFTPMYNALYALDPFELGMAGSSANLMHIGGANIRAATLIGGNNPLLENGGGVAQNNSMRYVSHTYNGFSLEFNYGFSGQSGSTSNGSETGTTINFANGPVTLLASYDGINSLDNGNRFKTTLVGGIIDWTEFGLPVKTSVGYQTNKGNDLVGFPNVDSTDLLVGLRIPHGPHELLFSYIHTVNKAGTGFEADQFAIGYTYALSKRTSFYTSIGQMINKNGADFTVGDGTNPGYGAKAFDMGIRHAF